MRPLPSVSRTASQFPSPVLMWAKFSGRTTSLAPPSTAWAINRSASPRLAETLGPEAIWTAATHVMAAEYQPFGHLTLPTGLRYGAP